MQRRLCLTLLALTVTACGDSSSKPEQDAAPDAGRPDDLGDSGAPGDGGTDALDGAVLGPDVQVGAFGIELVAPDEASAKPGYTALTGKVSDGPALSRIVWELSAEQDGCQLFEPRSPFCEQCSDICVEDDTCLPEPQVVDVGELGVQGLKDVQGAAAEVTVKPVQGTYATPAGLSLAYPPFAEGDTLRVAAGGSLAPFTIEAAGIAPLELTDETDSVIEPAQGLALAWVPRGEGGSSRIWVELDLSHHGGRKGRVNCDLDDDGAHTIAAELVDRLTELGVAGFPSVTLKRISVGSTRTAVGRIALEVFTSVRRELEIPGTTSCTSPEQCPDGQTCRADLTCG